MERLKNAIAKDVFSEGWIFLSLTGSFRECRPLIPLFRGTAFFSSALKKSSNGEWLNKEGTRGWNFLSTAADRVRSKCERKQFSTFKIEIWKFGFWRKPSPVYVCVQLWRSGGPGEAFLESEATGRWDVMHSKCLSLFSSKGPLFWCLRGKQPIPE